MIFKAYVKKHVYSSWTKKLIGWRISISFGRAQSQQRERSIFKNRSEFELKSPPLPNLCAFEALDSSHETQELKK